jgi:two-component system chemotaxis response regulator CheB
MSEKIEVMIIDDSPTIRGIERLILLRSNNINVTTVASNGRDALDKLENKELSSKLDVILIDIEMPIMDGREAIPKIRALMKNVKIIIVTSLSRNNIQSSIEALMKYADEYILKPTTAQGDASREVFAVELLEKVLALGEKRLHDKTHAAEQAKAKLISQQAPNPNFNSLSRVILKPLAIAIGASTGGPQAITTIFQNLKNFNFDIPIFITIHMPKNFTSMFASNLTIISGKECREAKDGEVVESNIIYVAPGDYHMKIINIDNKIQIRLNQNEPEHFCRPSVNPMLKSLSQVYGSRLLEVMLTGMGNDGIEGSRIVAEKGGSIIVQDEQSSVVWSMPGSVVAEGIFKKILPLNNIAQEIMRIMHG